MQYSKTNNKGLDLSLYGGADPRELPAYTMAEVAQYTGVPLDTLRTWVKGRTYPVEGGSKFFEPVITRPDPASSLLSFVNLVEIHILGAIRRKHNVPLYNVRRALNYLDENFPLQHPLADEKFATDGLNLFVERYGQIINASRHGQLEMRDLLESHLRQVERDPSGWVIRLYPFTRQYAAHDPKTIVIDSFVSFGRPVLVGTGIPIEIIAQRYKTGETIDELADDYGRLRLEIEDVIRCELQAA